MAERIEFEANFWFAGRIGEAMTASLLSIDGRYAELDSASDQRYRVTLEPVEPEPSPRNRGS